jgi:hypothetical protein
MDTKNFKSFQDAMKNTIDKYNKKDLKIVTIPVEEYNKYEMGNDEYINDIKAGNKVIDDVMDNHDKTLAYDYNINTISDEIQDKIYELINDKQIADSFIGRIPTAIANYYKQVQDANLYAIDDVQFKEYQKDFKDYLQTRFIMKGSRNGEEVFKLPFTQKEFDELKKDPTKLKTLISIHENGKDVLAMIDQNIGKDTKDEDTINVLVFLVDKNNQGEYSVATWTFTLSDYKQMENEFTYDISDDDPPIFGGSTVSIADLIASKSLVKENEQPDINLNKPGRELPDIIEEQDNDDFELGL